jgi:hypothetical protein
MAELIKSGTRITQINERINETQYDVLYPETRADVVQETFGSTVANWTAATSYKVGDNVLYGGLAYECKEAHTSTASFDATK